MYFRLFIPNFITCLNLLCGCAGIVLAFHHSMLWSAYLVGIAAVLDFFDGLAARLLNAGSEFGKQLDSLADLITFGLLPGIILFQMISIGLGEYYVPVYERPLNHLLLQSVAFLVPVFSALRLAKFNIDVKQNENFLGLPTPANALFIASFPVILELQYNLNFYIPPVGKMFENLQELFYWDGYDIFLVKMLFNPSFYIAVSIISAVLLVIRMPMFSLKFKSLSWQENKIRYIFLILVLLLAGIVILPYMIYVKNFPYIDYSGIPIVIILYLLLSFINNLVKHIK